MLESLLAAVLKVGLKAMEPYLGELAATAGEAAGGWALGEAAKRRARDVHGRLLAEMKNRVAEHARGLSVATQDHRHVAELAAKILELHGLRLGEWRVVHFDPDRATARVCGRAGRLLASLPPEQAALCRGLLQGFYEAWARQQHYLVETGAAFRSTVLDRIEALAQRLEQASAEAAAERRLVAEALIRYPVHRFDRWRSPPGSLLRADSDRAIAFQGRDRELRSLQAWLEDGRELGLRLYTGPGGMGKTRLALETCLLAELSGYRAGFLDLRSSRAPEHVFATLLEQAPRLIVVDYAERREAELERLLTAAAAAPVRVRILLLSRAQGDWWPRLQARRGLYEVLAAAGAVAERLGPVAADRRAVYDAAMAAFAAALQRDPAPGALPSIDGEAFTPILLVQMAALVALEESSSLSSMAVLDYMLARERRFWNEQLASRGLPDILQPAVAQAVACMTLIGGVREAQPARAMLAHVPLLKGSSAASLHAVAQLLHDTYPGDRWIEPVLPDLLGEQLIGDEAQRDPSILTFHEVAEQIGVG